MKAKLQYYTSGNWYDIGVIRFNDKKEYSINPILIENRLAVNEIAGYKIRCNCTVKELGPYFSMSYDEYAFRLVSLENVSLTLSLGTRKYNLSHEGSPGKISLEYVKIEIEFIIAASSFLTYTTFA